MNFNDFQNWRKARLQQHPDVLDCGETNLYRSLSQWRISPVDAGVQRIYRCDLSRLWLAHFGWNENRSRQALVCRGVRHALRLIFQELALDAAKLWLPQDVYPVYLSLAKESGLAPSTYTTLPRPALPPLGCKQENQDEFLLICNPWKPLGRHLSPEECDHLLQWLHESPRRRLLLDCVYDLSAPLHESTLTLEATQQTVILHSLTKGWLWPETFGVALFPETLQSRFEMAFRSDPPSNEQLAQAQACLTTGSRRPNEIADALRNRAEHFMQRLPPAVLHAGIYATESFASESYMFVVDMPANVLLEQHRVLGIPASAFGSANWNGSVLTSLAAPFNTHREEQAHAA